MLLHVSKQNVYPDPSRYCGPYKPIPVQKPNKRATTASIHAHDTIGRGSSDDNNNNPTLLLPVQLFYFKHLTESGENEPPTSQLKRLFTGSVQAFNLCPHSERFHLKLNPVGPPRLVIDRFGHETSKCNPSSYKCYFLLFFFVFSSTRGDCYWSKWSCCCWNIY